MEHIRFEQESSDEFDSSEEFEHTLEETSPNNTSEPRQKKRKRTTERLSVYRKLELQQPPEKKTKTNNTIQASSSMSNTQKNEKKSIQEEQTTQLEQLVHQLTGGSFDYTYGVRLSKQKAQEILQGLKNDKNESKQLESVSELCNFLSIGNQETVAATRFDLFIPELVKLLSKEHNVQLMLLAARSLTHMLDCLPPASSQVVNAGAVPVLAGKLLNIQYIDLAEQSLQCLSHLSYNYPHLLLKEGILTASLQYCDFFASNIQRTVLKMAANICRRVSRDTFNLVEPALSSLANFLQYSDQQIVENTVRAFANLVYCFPVDSEKLDKICGEGLIPKLINVIDAKSTNQQTMSITLILLTNLCYGSFSALKQLHEKGIGIILQNALKRGIKIYKLLIPQDYGLSSSENSPSSNTYTTEILTLMAALLPRVPKEKMFVSQMTNSRRTNLFMEIASPPGFETEEREYVSFGSSRILKETEKQLIKFFQDKEQVLINFGQLKCITLPLMEVFSSNTVQNIRYRCLSVIATLLYFCSQSATKEILRDITFSTFLSGLLSSSDMVEVATAIQLAEMLMEKLPEIFKIYFVREGVVNEIKRLSGIKPGDKSPTLLEKMKIKVKEAFENAEKERKAKMERMEKQENERMKLEEEVAKENQKEKKKESSKQKQVSKSEKASELFKFLQKRGLRKPPAARKQITVPFVRPYVDSPEIPSSSRLAGQKTKQPELVGYVVAKAQIFQKTYFDEPDQTKYDGPVVKKMRELGENLCKYIESPNAKEEEEILLSIGKALVNSEGISNFEFLHSGIIGCLLDYLTKKSSNDADGKQRLERVLKFCKVFTMPSDEQEEPSMVSSPFKSNIQGVQRSFFLELVRKLINCLDIVANFPLIVEDNQSLFYSIIHVFRSLSRDLKVNLQKYSETSKSDSKKAKEKKPIANLSINPLASVEDLTEYFESKKKRKEEELLHQQLEKKLKEKKAKEDKTSKKDEKKKDKEIIKESSSKDEKKDAMEIERHEEAITDEEENDEEETHGRTEYISDRFNEFSGFSVDEYYDSEDDFSSSRSRVIDLKRPDESKDEYAFLTEPEEKPEPKKETPSTHYEFLINGQVLPPHWNVFKAIYTYGKNRDGIPYSSNHPYHCRLWDTIHEISYRELTEEEAKKRKQADEDELPTFDTNYETFFDQKLEDLSFLEKDAYESLQLLRILYGLNITPEKLQLKKQVKEIIPSSLFISGKITAALTRQTYDPFMLLSFCLPTWCFKIVLACPFLFSFETRKQFFDLTTLGIARALKILQEKIPRDGLRFKKQIQIVRIERQKLRIGRTRILEYAYKVLNLYGVGSPILEFEYFDEVGSGLGPTLEFYTLVSREFQTSKLQIWRDENHEKSGKYVVAPLGLFPRPYMDGDKIPKIRQIFKFLGLFIARAIYDGRLLDLSFSDAFLKILRGEELVFEDIQLIDPLLYKQLVKMKDVITKKRLIESDTKMKDEEKKQAIENITMDGKTIENLMLDFTVPGYPDVELEKDGANKDLTIWNIEDYVDKLVKCILKDGIKHQIEAFKEGFNTLLDFSMLRIFSTRELDDILAGCTQTWDEKILMASTRTDHGFSKSSKTIKNLFKVLSEMGKEDQKLFLQFVTGCPKLPVGGLANLNPPLTIVKKDSGKNADSFLPSAMTCTNYLKLPDYSSITVLREQLYRAIRDGQGSFLLS